MWQKVRTAFIDADKLAAESLRWTLLASATSSEISSVRSPYRWGVARGSAYVCDAVASKCGTGGARPSRRSAGVRSAAWRRSTPSVAHIREVGQRVRVRKVKGGDHLTEPRAGWRWVRRDEEGGGAKLKVERWRRRVGAEQKWEV